MSAVEHTNGARRARGTEPVTRSLPHDIQAEASILGGVILDPSRLAELEDLETEDFFLPQHRVVFEAMRNLQASDRPVDLTLLEYEIGTKGKLDAIGGVAFLGELALRVPTAENVLAYRDIVVQLSHNRRYILELSSTLERAKNWQHDPLDLVAETAGHLQRFIETDKRRLEQSTPWTTAPQLVDAIMERAADPWVSLTLGTHELARVRVGSTVVIIGGSGSGKSSLTMNMIMEHARDVGPSIALSIELPQDELAARGVGIKCDASWEDVLRGRVKREDMERALDLPRLFVLSRRRATLENLEKCIDAARKAYPGQPILVAIDYAQLLESDEYEARLRVADIFAKIDDVAREKKVAVLALSQMSRANADKARSGDMIGKEAAAAGAESAAIERFATLTLTIGMSSACEDGSDVVELSVGKARMGSGDKVFPARYWGRSGSWRLTGEAKKAEEVREQRETAKVEKREKAAEMQIIGTLAKSDAPLSRNTLLEQITGNRKQTLLTISRLIASGDIVEIAKRGPRSKAWLLWTVERAQKAGEPLVRDTEGALFQ